MISCDHKTQLHGVCIRCRAFETIAKNARLLLQARKRYLDSVLVPTVMMDRAQEEMQEALRNLERSVDFATQSNLWD